MKIDKIQDDIKRRTYMAIGAIGQAISDDLEERIKDYYAEDWSTRKYKRTDKMKNSIMNAEYGGRYPFCTVTAGYNANYNYDTGSWGGEEVIDSATNMLHGGDANHPSEVSVFPLHILDSWPDEIVRDAVRPYFS